MTGSTPRTRWPSRQPAPRCLCQVRGRTPRRFAQAVTHRLAGALRQCVHTGGERHSGACLHSERTCAACRARPCTRCRALRAKNADIPFQKAVAGVHVGWIDGQPVVNPTVSQRARQGLGGWRKPCTAAQPLPQPPLAPARCTAAHAPSASYGPCHVPTSLPRHQLPHCPRRGCAHPTTAPQVAQQACSKLDLTLAGTRDAVLMIEGFCDFLTEEQMLEVRGGDGDSGGGFARCWRSGGAVGLGAVAGHWQRAPRARPWQNSSQRLVRQLCGCSAH